MFFPFINYTTIEGQFDNEGGFLIGTIPVRAYVVIEEVSNGVPGQSYAYEYNVTVNMPQTAANYATSYTLLSSAGDSGGAIVIAGTTVVLNRGSQYGTTIIRAHIFELPALPLT